MTTVKAKFDGRVFVPEEPVDLPVGYELEIAIDALLAGNGTTPTESAALPVENGANKQKTALQELAEAASKFPPSPDLPRDYAAQIDHYLHGLPKRP